MIPFLMQDAIILSLEDSFDAIASVIKEFCHAEGLDFAQFAETLSARVAADNIGIQRFVGPCDGIGATAAIELDANFIVHVASRLAEQTART